MKQCPKCKLINAGSPGRCDCGYDFESGQVKESYVETVPQPKAAPSIAHKRVSWVKEYTGYSATVAVVMTFSFLALYGNEVLPTSNNMLEFHVLVVSIFGVYFLKLMFWPFLFAALFYGVGRWIDRTWGIQRTAPYGTLYARIWCGFAGFELLALWLRWSIF